jgi:hypothetical protein
MRQLILSCSFLVCKQKIVNTIGQEIADFVQLHKTVGIFA